MQVKTIFKDPLIHFFVFGAVLFGVYFWWQGTAPDRNPQQAPNQIVIKQQDLEHLIALWKLQWKRDPSPSDVEAILERHIRQEVFYREALKMGLDRNDQIIRNRLSQKMEDVANDLSMLMKPPTEERLREYFHERASFFTLPPAFAFKQILFPANEPEAKTRMATLLEQLKLGEPVPAARQNKLAVPSAWPLTPDSEIDHAFGGEFVAQLRKQPTGQWIGPIESGYGSHLVYIEARQAAKLPEFGQVRDYVAREYEYQAVLEAQNQVYDELRRDYEVVVEAEPPGPVPNTDLAKK